MGRSALARAGVIGVLGALMLGGLIASAASAHDTGTFQDKDYKVTLVSLAYDAEANQTTIKFKLEGTDTASHITIVPCGSPKLMSAKGPSGPVQTESGQDPSTEHSGTKINSATMGDYEVVYEGNVPGLEVIVKNGPGHKHFPLQPCTAETTTPSTPENTSPTTENTSPASENSNPPANNPSGNPAANQPSESGTQVAGNTQTKPGSDVLGDQLTAPEAQADLPRTGLPVPALASLGTTLLALGGLATALGRRRG